MKCLEYGRTARPLNLVVSFQSPRGLTYMHYVHIVSV
jgi:hypothetical protein